MNADILIAGFVGLLALGGAYLFLKEEYERQQQTTDSKAFAMLKALNEYLIKDIGVTIVKFLIFAPLIVFVVGGVVGLLLIGWDWLLGLLN